MKARGIDTFHIFRLFNIIRILGKNVGRDAYGLE